MWLHTSLCISNTEIQSRTPWWPGSWEKGLSTDNPLAFFKAFLSLSYSGPNGKVSEQCRWTTLLEEKEEGRQKTTSFLWVKKMKGSHELFPSKIIMRFSQGWWCLGWTGREASVGKSWRRLNCIPMEKWLWFQLQNSCWAVLLCLLLFSSEGGTWPFYTAPLMPKDTPVNRCFTGVQGQK